MTMLRPSRRPLRAVLGVVLVALASTRADAQLLHFYDFSGASATDAVGGAHGSLLGGATVLGGRLMLDGLNDYVQFGSHIVPTSGSYTVSLFARQAVGTSIPSYSEFISQGSSGGPGFYIGTAGYGMRATDSWQPPGSLITDGRFHMYSLVVDGSAAQSMFYIDGVLTGSTGFAITTTTGGDDTRLGNQFAGHGEWFAGDLDDVRIYGNALSERELAAMAIAGPTSAVPEPATLWLLGAGLGALVVVRRRAAL